MTTSVETPVLPVPPDAYSKLHQEQLQTILRLYFGRLASIGHLNLASLNIDTATLPTEADVATLRVGDVYRDTTAGNALKVKV